jgi:chromosome segregation ATPase
MRPTRTLIAAGLISIAMLVAHDRASGQESPEDRMRDALRQAVTEMRAAQDQAAQAQADLQKAQAEKADLQKQLDAAKAAPAAPTVKPEALAALQARLQEAQAQASGAQQMNAKLQAELQGSQALAQAKDSESRQSLAAQKSASRTLDVCKATNAKLIDVSEQVLHLYESQSFRSILLKSYEPIVGAAKVTLENLVQDYDDKIRDQQFVPPRK